MDNLFCVGTETNLTQCNFDGWGVHDCEGEEAAGVVCKSHFATTTPTPTLPPRDQPRVTNKTKLAVSTNYYYNIIKLMYMTYGSEESVAHIRTDSYSSSSFSWP